jgi:hypothetical protein
LTGNLEPREGYLKRILGDNQTKYHTIHLHTTYTYHYLYFIC